MRSGVSSRQVHRVVRAPAGGLRRCHGGQLERASLGTQARGARLGSPDHLGSVGRALPKPGRERQERRQRRGRDLRGCFAADDALRSGQDRSSSRACCACTGCARGSRKTARRASTASAAFWPSSGWCSPRALASCRPSWAMCIEDASNELGSLARLTLQRAQAQWHELDEHLAWCDQRITAHGQSNAAVKAAATLLGIGPVTRLGRRGHGRRLQAVQERRAVRSLDGTDAAPALQRWQEQPGRDHQARRRLSAYAADPGRQVGRYDGAPTAGQDLDYGPRRCASARAGRRRSSRWQTRTPDPVGGDDARSGLRSEPPQRQACSRLSTPLQVNEASLHDVKTKTRWTGQTGSGQARLTLGGTRSAVTTR